MPRTLRSSCVLVLAVLAFAACATTAAAPRRATSVRLFVPFGPGRVLQPGVTVTERLEGRCFAPSTSSEARSDAWRCLAGNRILDPCFEGSIDGRPALACARSPWESTVVLLTPTEELPTAGRREASSVLEGRPWALELVDGSRCTLLGGASGGVAGMRVNYGCEGNRVSLVGDVDRRAPRWKIFAVPADGPTLEQRSIGTAWY